MQFTGSIVAMGYVKTVSILSMPGQMRVLDNYSGLSGWSTALFPIIGFLLHQAVWFDSGD